jgi:hypothetical protein
MENDRPSESVAGASRPNAGLGPGATTSGNEAFWSACHLVAHSYREVARIVVESRDDPSPLSSSSLYLFCQPAFIELAACLQILASVEGSMEKIASLQGGRALLLVDALQLVLLILVFKSLAHQSPPSGTSTSRHPRTPSA